MQFFRLSCEIFGSSSPITCLLFSHLNKVGKRQETDGSGAEAALELNALNWVGMEPNGEYAEIAAVGAKTAEDTAFC